MIYVRNEVAPRCSFGGWGVQQHRLPAHKRATALHSQEEIKADHKPECPVLSAFRQKSARDHEVKCPVAHNAANDRNPRGN